MILSYIRGDDIGNVYCKLNDSEKKQIAKEVVKIQRKVSRLDIHADMEWTWNCFVDKMLNRAEKRIKRKNYFDFNKICIIKKLQQEIQEYLDKVPIAPYLDDISTKNLLIYEGNVSGIIDIDWMGFGDMLTFVALTRVSLLNMDLDTKYIDYLLDEIRPNTIEYKAFIFYCLIYCVDFMGEIGMQFLDKTIPVNENIIERLNDIFDFLMEEWDKYWQTVNSSLTEELYMKKYRTVACVIIMAIAAIAGFFIGATLDETMGGSILFSMIAGIACIVYSIENREE